jgi:hypothetical protein
MSRPYAVIKFASMLNMTNFDSSLDTPKITNRVSYGKRLRLGANTLVQRECVIIAG